MILCDTGPLVALFDPKDGKHRVFTIDRPDFETYRIRHGHRHHRFELVS